MGQYLRSSCVLVRCCRHSRSSITHIPIWPERASCINFICKAIFPGLSDPRSERKQTRCSAAPVWLDALHTHLRRRAFRAVRGVGRLIETEEPCPEAGEHKAERYFRHGRRSVGGRHFVPSRSKISCSVRACFTNSISANTVKSNRSLERVQTDMQSFVQLSSFGRSSCRGRHP